MHIAFLVSYMEKWVKRSKKFKVVGNNTDREKM